MLRFLALLVAAAALAGCGGSGGTSGGSTSPGLTDPSALTAKAPSVYKARFTTTQGAFVVTVHRAWAPLGADRFYNLVEAGFYDGQRLFRVVPDFVVQWGISGDPDVSSAWRNATIPDDPVKHSNTANTVAFADAGPDTRTTQVFVNLRDNSSGLDSQGFAPFGQVTSGFAVFGKLYSGYDDEPTNAQAAIQAQGESYLAKTYPKLDRIVSARVVP
ncbi:MAG TPA: peptidylprolyl isomerase [Gaiellaceae bacterium]|nr:peptidylprolyl isomerase [Gaiellaceae bacterium]